MKRYLNGRIRRGMNSRIKSGIKGRAGTTLVEMVVTMLLMVIILAMIVGILSPAAKIFIRMQKLQYAQLILDNTAQELRSMAAEATEYVKIHRMGGGTDVIAGMKGYDDGPILEFINPEGYAVLISAEGSVKDPAKNPEERCEATDILLGETKINTADAVQTGRLFARYYNTYNTESGTKEYIYRKGGRLVARALSKTFADGYYMGNYLQITFSFPENIVNGNEVTYITAKLCLYNNSDRLPEHLVAQEEVILDFRYKVKRNDLKTARDGDKL